MWLFISFDCWWCCHKATNILTTCDSLWHYANWNKLAPSSAIPTVMSRRLSRQEFGANHAQPRPRVHREPRWLLQRSSVRCRWRSHPTCSRAAYHRHPTLRAHHTDTSLAADIIAHHLQNCADDVRLYCGIWSRAGSKLFLAYLVFRFVQRNNQNGLPPGSVPDPTRADTPTRHSPEPPVGFEGWLHSKGKRKGRKHARYKFLAMALILDVASAQQQWLCSVANSHDQTGMHLAF